eukprot:GEMP01031231.1.p1 GENE.GEMP01031231.1~~GEMP01031231.1.p1  ORF type:complete len:388 (+),score=88.54 GEMP01031231.1:173-1165(+)
MMSVFCQNPGQFMDEFSREFEKGYMLLMSTTYCKTRVLANDVYREYIQERDHLHMNSTIWVTLSGFVQYLGRTEQCKIEKTHKGWYLEYIDNSPEAKKREDDKLTRQLHDLTDEDRHKKLLDQMIKEGKAAGGFQEAEYTELQRTDDVPLNLKMNFATKVKASARAGNVFDQPEADDTAPASATAGKRSASESIQENKRHKRKLEDKQVKPKADEATPLDNWVRPGIIVKVMHKKLGDGAFFKKKGEVIRVHDKFAADVKMLENGKTVRLDQDDLETVIPAVGKQVAVVLGKHRGQEGVIADILIDEFKVIVELEGTRVQLRYEQICKLA